MERGEDSNASLKRNKRLSDLLQSWIFPQTTVFFHMPINVSISDQELKRDVSSM